MHPPKVYLVKFVCLQVVSYWVFEEKKKRCVPLDESYLNQKIPGYTRLSEAARRKELGHFVSKAKIICKACTPKVLENTCGKIAALEGKKHPPDKAAFLSGIRPLLGIPELFEDSISSYSILCNVLCGPRCEALRKAEPNFRPIISISSLDHKLIDIFRVIVKAVVTQKKWQGKKCKIKRKVILDYRDTTSTIGCHVQDFSRVKIKEKNGVHITTPVNYVDTVALLIGASNAQLREASPYLENACVFLIGCGVIEWSTEKLSTNSVSTYNPDVLDSLINNREFIAAVLRVWWAAEDEDNWAQNIVAKAKASFGKLDTNYVAVTINPQKLRTQIQYYVLQSFFDEVERLGWITTEELEQSRKGAKAVFDPEPMEEKKTGRMEEPEVFLALIGQITQEKHDSILQDNEPFVKADKPYAAYRNISNERYLVMLESDFKKVYAKVARKANGVDTSFLQKPNWERELQRILCEADMVKVPSAGYRYRYDLFQNGTRDKTYILAIPCNLLENTLAKSTATSVLPRQTALPESLPNIKSE